MTVFNPGSGASIKSTTVESAFLELIVRAANAPRLPNAPEDAALSYQISSTTKTLTGTMVVPFSSSLTGGLITTNPTPFLDESGYISGTGGDLASSGLIDNLVELAYRVNELPPTPESTVGGLDLTMDMDAKRLTTAFVLPISFSVGSDGVPTITAEDFLV